MTVAHNPFVIIDIVETKQARLEVGGSTLMERPELDMYHVKAVLKSYIEKTRKGRKMLKKLGHGEKLGELESEYLKTTDSFTATIPITHQTLNLNKYHVGGEIMIAYYPMNVYAKFHIKGEE